MKIPKSIDLNKEQLGVWFGRITRAYAARKPHHDRWIEINEYLNGRYFGDHADHDRVAASWHLVMLRQMVSSLYHHDPRMNFRGTTRRGQLQALVAEQVMSYTRNRIGASFEERACIKSGLAYGQGILKYGWQSEFGEELPWSDERIKKSRGRMMHDDAPASEDSKLPAAPMTEHDTRFQMGMPWIKHIPTQDFIIDPEARTIKDARWFAHRFHRPWAQAVNDERWDEEARDNLSPTGQSRYWMNDSTEERQWYENLEAVDSSLCTFYEIFDRTTQRIIVLSDSTTHALSVRPYPFFGKSGPYVVYQPLPADDSPWGMSWLDTFTPQATALNKLRTHMMEHFERLGVPKGFYMGSIINEKTMQRFAESRTGEFVRVDMPPNGNVKNAFSVIDPVPLNADAWRLSDLFKNDMQEVSGITENALGGGKGVNTATEASIIQQQVSQRQGDMRNGVDDLIGESTRKIMTIQRQFWTGQQIMPIVGPSGEVWDFPVDDTLINGEYDVDIETGSTERVDRNVRLKQGIELLQMLTQMQPALMQQGKIVDLADMTKRILAESEFVKNPDRVVYDIPPEQMQQMAMAQQGQQPQGQGQPQQRNIQNVQRPAAVNNMGQVHGTRESDVRGRQLSEAAAR